MRFISSLSVVVLPAPVGPISAKMLAAGTRSSSPRPAPTRRKLRTSPAVSIENVMRCSSSRPAHDPAPLPANGRKQLLQRQPRALRLDDDSLDVVFHGLPPFGPQATGFVR